MKDGLRGILGKSISNVVVASRDTAPKQQVFLVFSDGTYFEFYGEQFNCAGSVDLGDLVEVLDYAKRSMQANIDTVYSGEEQVIQTVSKTISATAEKEDDDVLSIITRDAVEEALGKCINRMEVLTKNPEFALGAKACDICGRSLEGLGLYVDGKLRSQPGWGNMCAKCFSLGGVGLGWGVGQLYSHQLDGQWRLVAGFRPTDYPEGG